MTYTGCNIKKQTTTIPLNTFVLWLLLLSRLIPDLDDIVVFWPNFLVAVNPAVVKYLGSTHSVLSHQCHRHCLQLHQHQFRMHYYFPHHYSHNQWIHRHFVRFAVVSNQIPYHRYCFRTNCHQNGRFPVNVMVHHDSCNQINCLNFDIFFLLGYFIQVWIIICVHIYLIIPRVFVR